MKRLLLLLGSVLLFACAGEDRSPAGTMRHFIQAAEEGDLNEVYRMIDPASQKRLAQRARLANAQTGEGHRFKPTDLLIAGQMPSLLEIHKIQLLKLEGSRAQISIASYKGKEQQTWDMVQIGNEWRIVLNNL